MDERPLADPQAGVRRWAVWLAFAAAIGPVVEHAAFRIIVDEGPGLGEPLWLGLLAVAVQLVVRTGVPLVGALLTLRGGTDGPVVLTAFGILQLPIAAGMAWQVLGSGMPPWFWFTPLVAVAAGAFALAVLLAALPTAEQPSVSGGRGLVVAGAVALALSGVLPAGMGLLTWPYGLLTLLHPLTLLLLAAGVALLQVRAALLVAAILALVAVTDLTGLALSMLSPLFTPGTAVYPAALLLVVAAALLVAGTSALRREARA